MKLRNALAVITCLLSTFVSIDLWTYTYKRKLFKQEASDEAQTVARITNQTYEHELERKMTIDGYLLDKELNQASQCVYTNGTTLVIAFRGSTTLQDWVVHNLAILLLGFLAYPVTKIDVHREFFKTAMKKHRPQRLILAGHSLGGNVAARLLSEEATASDCTGFPEDYVAHLFNAGGTMLPLAIDMMRKGDWIDSHIVSHHIWGDIISSGPHLDATHARDNNYKGSDSRSYWPKPGMNQHSMSNFL